MPKSKNDDLQQPQSGPRAEPSPPQPAANADAPAESSADPGTPGLAEAIAEAEHLRQRLMHWQADFENLQRRSAREILAARQTAEGDFARALLDVLDHFQSALSIDPAKTDAQTILDGIKITYDELAKVLAQRGIESFDPAGEPFDPHRHEAIAREVTAEKPPMTVLQTLQLGYQMGQRILRPAKVKVSMTSPS